MTWWEIKWETGSLSYTAGKCEGGLRSPIFSAYFLLYLRGGVLLICFGVRRPRCGESSLDVVLALRTPEFPFLESIVLLCT